MNTTQALASIAWSFGALFATCSTIFWAILVWDLAPRTSDGKMRLSSDDKAFLGSIGLGLAAMWGVLIICWPFGRA